MEQLFIICIICLFSVIILGFEMANYSFVESSGQLDNAIMIMKNSVVVDTDIVVNITLDLVGQTALNCKLGFVNT